MKNIILLKSENEVYNKYFKEYADTHFTVSETFLHETIETGKKIGEFIRDLNDTLIIHNPDEELLLLLRNIDLITSACNFDTYMIELSDFTITENYDFIVSGTQEQFNKKLDFIFSIQKEN